MSRINTNVQSLIAQRVLQQNQNQLNTSLERLSTGLKINRGKDDPAGLIASENLNGESRSINTAINNAQRADQVVNIAEGGLQEVSGLLTELQSLVTASPRRPVCRARRSRPTSCRSTRSFRRSTASPARPRSRV